MRTLLWIIGLFALAVGLTLFAQVNTGYALLFVPPWRIELSLNVAIIVLVIVVALLYALSRLVVEITTLPQRVSSYRARKVQEQALRAEHESRLAFFEGRYQRAEKLAADAMAASPSDDAFAVNALLAARAAHMTRDFARRDRHLSALEARLGDSHLASIMTRAELLLDERRFAEAGTALEQARAIAPKLTAALRLELRLRQREGNPDAVLKLLDQLARAEALGQEQIQRLHLHACLQKLRQQNLTVNELKDWWRRLPDTDRVQPQLVHALADCYRNIGHAELAQDVIEQALAQQWSSELAECYGSLKLQGEALEQQLAQAERWLTQHPDDHRLLLTLGRLCLARELWGKAQNYLEASIAVHPTAVAYAELARLCERLERMEEANLHYRTSLELALAH